MPFKHLNGDMLEDGYWDPPRPVQHADIAMEGGSTSQRVAGRFCVNQPWLDDQWGKTAAVKSIGGKRRRSEDTVDETTRRRCEDSTRIMMAATRKPGAALAGEAFLLANSDEVDQRARICSRAKAPRDFSEEDLCALDWEGRWCGPECFQVRNPKFYTQTQTPHPTPQVLNPHPLARKPSGPGRERMASILTLQPANPGFPRVR